MGIKRCRLRGGLQKALRSAICLIICCSIILFTSGTAFGTEDDITVKVGFFPLPGFNEYDSMGNPSGYNIEYLQEVTRYTNWSIELVEAANWSDAVEKLRRGEIDLLAPAQKTPQREVEFGFCDYPFGTEYGAILTGTDSDIHYDDFERFGKIRFGCVQGLVFEKDFFAYAQGNGFNADVTYYTDNEKLVEALNAGQVDAIVVNLMQAKEGLKIVGKFAPSQFYYIVAKDNEQLLNELNSAVSSIKVTNPGIESELTEQYLPFYNNIAFTAAELEYVATAPVFNMGCVTNRDPISYLNPATGEIEGIAIDLIKRISQISGLRFNIVPLPVGTIPYSYLRDNRIEILSCVENNTVNFLAPGLKLSSVYLSTRKVMVNKTGTIDRNAQLRMAVTTGSETLDKVIKVSYPNTEMVICDTVEDGFEAVISGNADLLMQNQYAVDRLMHKPKYKSLKIIPFEGIQDDICFAPILYQQDMGVADPILADKRLISILNKAINTISDNERQEIIIQHTTNRPYQLTLEDFFHQYMFYIVFAIIAGGAIVAALVYAYIQKANSARVLRSSEIKLKNITDNINGGVVVLQPGDGLTISFANEGFLSLLQYTARDYDQIQQQNYVNFVHPDDMVTLTRIMNVIIVGNKQLSMQLRLRRRDGSYLPILFNGTLVANQIGRRELYCVIMDISEQIKTTDRLRLERARYKLVLERSNDMIFDINLENHEIGVSKTFKEKFGWTLPASCADISVDSIAALWQVHHDDQQLMKNSVTRALHAGEDSDCRVRLRKGDHSYRWCHISYNLMKQNGVASYITGRVTDVNQETLEKEKLLLQARKDSLSGLYNKETFYELATRYLKEKPDENSAIIFVDLDNFRNINNLLGHMVGDRAIHDTAQKLQLIFSQQDLTSRFGGDEYCILVKNIPDEALFDKLNWMVEKMKATYSNDKHSVNVTVSIGVAMAPRHGTAIEELMERADKALYSAKEHGKSRYEVFSEELDLQGYQPRQQPGR